MHSTNAPAEPEPLQQELSLPSDLRVFVGHREGAVDAQRAELVRQCVGGPNISVGPVEACPTDARVAVFLLSSDQAPFEHIRREDDPLHVALAALFMREQVLIPVVDLEFSTDQLEGLPDDIRSLARQLFVPMDWGDMTQGTQTLLRHLCDVEANKVSSVIRQYLETTILETETFPDPCTQEEIHTETQCVPLKLVTVKELQHSRVNTTKVCDVSDMMILRQRDGLGDTVGFGNSGLLSTLGEQLIKEADVHFADARADQATRRDAMLVVAVIVGPAACGTALGPRLRRRDGQRRRPRVPRRPRRLARPLPGANGRRLSRRGLEADC